MKDKILGIFGGPGNLKGCFVAGGAITSLYTNKPINDWDVYAKTEEDRDNAIQWVYESGYFCAHVSSRALTFVNKDEAKIQIMTFDVFPTAEKIFETFDFTVCMGAFDLDSLEFILHEKFLLHNSQRFISFNPKTRFPYDSAWRIRKYEERGYTIGKMEHIKVLLACANTQIKSWDDLAEQVGGCYGEAISIPRDKEFSFEAAIEAVSTLKPVTTVSGYENYETAIAATSNREIKYVSVDGKMYADIFDDGGYTKVPTLKNGKQVSTEELFQNTFWKAARRNTETGKIVSIYKSTFEYPLDTDITSSDPYIYCYASVKDAKGHWVQPKIGYETVILKLYGVPEDIYNLDGYFKSSYSRKIQIKRCRVVEVFRPADIKNTMEVVDEIDDLL